MRTLFSLSCGCKDSKSVSEPVSLSSDTSDKSAAATTKTSQNPLSSSTATVAATTTTATADDAASTSSSPSFSSLLRQLSELERSVVAWAPPLPLPSRHRRCRSDAGVGVRGRRGLEESVAVVKESEDPLSDFRRSMLQMIIEKEIVDGDDLRDLVGRFLRLNSPRHHDLILRAFAEIWSEVFSVCEDSPDLLRRSRANHLARRRR